MSEPMIQTPLSFFPALLGQLSSELLERARGEAKEKLIEAIDKDLNYEPEQRLEALHLFELLDEAYHQASGREAEEEGAEPLTPEQAEKLYDEAEPASLPPGRIEEIVNYATTSTDTYGVRQIAAERRRQIEGEGWDAEQDAQHIADELAWAAVCYAAPDKVRRAFPVVSKRSVGDEWRDPWPWTENWDKREKHDRERQLVIAGALIAAELDRRLRARAAESEVRS